MSRSESPASSLDFEASDKSGSEEEYNPSSRRRAPNKRVPGGKKGLSLKINLSALQRARDVAAAHPAEGDVEDDDGADWQDVEGVIGTRGVDLSGQPLKDDHAIRPLWVDDNGNMYVSPFASLHGEPKMTIAVQHSRGVRNTCFTCSRLSHCHRGACVPVSSLKGQQRMY